jgi:chorismate-pyruvate lyase
MREEGTDVLEPLRRLHGAASGKFVFVEGDGVPEPFHGLLVHEGDMTSRLEAFHQSKISLQVLQSRRSGEEEYSREVILRRQTDGAAVEYGAIQIFLGVFERALREEILEGRVPLGGLLNREGVRYYSRPQAFFEMEPGSELAGLIGVPPTARLFGRCNRLYRDGGNLMARIVEVLPLTGMVSFMGSSGSV